MSGLQGFKQTFPFKLLGITWGESGLLLSRPDKGMECRQFGGFWHTNVDWIFLEKK